MNDLSTKEKILKCARVLFGEKGLNGVSVRDIANASDVNVAAVNYHFSNKDNLYFETVNLSVQQTYDDIKDIYDALEEKDIEVLMIMSFRSLVTNEEDSRSCIRLILGLDGVHEELAQNLSRFKGPPGGEFAALCLKSEFPKVNDEQIFSSVRILFTHMMHNSMVMNNPQIRAAISRIGIDQKVIEKDIKRLVRLIRSDLGVQ